MWWTIKKLIVPRSVRFFFFFLRLGILYRCSVHRTIIESRIPCRRYKYAAGDNRTVIAFGTSIEPDDRPFTVQHTMHVHWIFIVVTTLSSVSGVSKCTKKKNTKNSRGGGVKKIFFKCSSKFKLFQPFRHEFNSLLYVHTLIKFKRV